MHSFLMLEKGLQNTDLYWKKVDLLQRKIFSFLLKISQGLPSMFIKLTNCLADTEVIVTDHLLLEFSDKGIKFCISSQFLWDSFL